MVYWFHNILLSLDVTSMVLWFKVHSNLVFSNEKKKEEMYKQMYKQNPKILFRNVLSTI